ncbi:Uncharacterised protein [Mycobacteroides abscessus subsp. abscessus]|nr:Uncharacterised protein [Mycobacteroides abscessus subsp. abscessus]
MSTTFTDTLPMSSESRRDFTIRAVSLCPDTLPASGELLVPMVTEIAGSSTVMRGSACACSGSASVSPIMISDIPATATMSPATASSVGLRSTPSVASSSVIFALVMTGWPSTSRIHATCWPLRIRPL